MPHGLWHARLHCPSLSPGNCSNSCPLSCCCYPTISSSVTLLFSCLRSFPASRSFPMSWLFASSSQSIGASGSVLTVPMNTQGWFPLGLNGLISLQSKELSKGFSSTTVWKHQFFGAQPSLWSNSWTTGKAIALTIWTFVSKLMSLLLNMLSRFVMAFFSKEQTSFNFMGAVTIRSDFGAQENKICHCFLPPPPSVCHEVMGPDAMILVFWMLSFKPTFSLYSFTFIKRLFSSSWPSAIRVVSSAYLRLLIFIPAILTPACDSSSPAFHMMYSAYNINKQGDNIQPWHTPFWILNQFTVPCLVLTVASWPAYSTHYIADMLLSLGFWENI